MTLPLGELTIRADEVRPGMVLRIAGTPVRVTTVVPHPGRYVLIRGHNARHQGLCESSHQPTDTMPLLEATP